MKRCQHRDEKGRQCALPEGHLCDHDCLSEPLSLGQGLSWSQEARLQRELGARRAMAAAGLADSPEGRQ